MIKPQKLKISSKKSKAIISRLVRQKFDSDIKNDEAIELIAIAKCWNLDCLEEMLTDYETLKFRLW